MLYVNICNKEEKEASQCRSFGEESHRLGTGKWAHVYDGELDRLRL